MLPVDTGCSEFVFGSRVSEKPEIGSIFIDDKHVSRQHCRIFWSTDWTVEDLGSSNGSYLDEEILLHPTTIPPSGEIRIGTTCITLCLVADLSPEDIENSEIATQLKPLHHPVGDHATVRMDFEDETDSLSEEVTQVAPTSLSSEEITQVAPKFHPSEEVTQVATLTKVSRVTPEQTLKKIVVTENTPPPTDTPFGLAVPRPKVTVFSDSTPLMEEKNPLSTVETNTTIKKGIPKTLNTDVLKKGIDSSSSRTRGLERRYKHGFFHGAERRCSVDRRTIGGALVFKESANDPFFQRLLQANLLDYRDVRSILGKAQSQGHTALFMLANESSIRFWSEIYTLLADYSELPLIDQESVLIVRAMETNWFSFGEAIERGAVLLTGGNPGQTLYGTVDPWNLEVEDWIHRCSGQPVDKIILQGDVFIKVMRQLKENASRRQGGESDVVLDLSIEQEEVMRENLNDADIPQLVNYILHRALLQRVSDVHVEPSDDLLIVRNRVDGYLHNELSLPNKIHSEVASRIKILSGMDVAEKRRPLDGRFGISSNGRNYDVRVSSYPTVYGEKFVLRLLDQNAVVGSLESLGLLPKDLQMLKDRTNAPLGLILISGPTGSGKTTTLYSCLGSLDATGKNIVTVEDPVEYRMKGVHQMQINPKLGLTFSSGLRTILRQDPDVIMVGECRDHETSGMAVQSALTGHVVFSTIHANDAVGVVSRLLNMDIESFMVASALSVTMAQRLVRIICPHCKTGVLGETILAQLESGSVSRQRLELLGIRVNPLREYAQGAGCKQCRNTGYKGRRAVFEIYAIDSTVRSMIIQPDFDVENLRDYANKQGMTTLLSHGLQLVEEDTTTFEEIIRVMGEKY